jgi:hypothetical protein
MSRSRSTTHTSRPAARRSGEDTVTAFLDRVEAGGGASLGDLYHPTAILDATVPNWRFEVRGNEAIAAEYGRWFYEPGRFEEQARRTVPGGEVVTYLLSWEEGGVPHAAHHCHVLTVEDGLITREQVFCGGRWPAALLAEMAAADAG